MEKNEQKIILERHKWPDEILEEKNQKKKKRRKLLLTFISSAMLISVSFTLGYTFNNRHYISSQMEESNTVIDEVLNYMSNNWYFGQKDEKLKDELVDKALYGMTQSEVDPHTTYMSNEEMTTFFESINSNFVGIGVKVRSNGTYLVVNTVYRNSPADESGIQKGDMIIAVDGKDVAGLEMDEVVKLIKGEENTKVTITVLRDEQHLDIDVIRKPVNTTVEGEVLDNNVGYIMLSSFGELSKEQMETYLVDFQAQGVNKLLLDLRDDGGGHLESVVDIGGLFLPKGTVVLQQEKADGSIGEYRCDSNRQYTYDKIVILVNGNTASAAEVLTLALKEQLPNVSVVGTKTYGKGTIQSTVYLSDGSSLKYTTAKWNSANGTNIDQKGIEPDVVVELPTIITSPLLALEEDESYQYDQVSLLVIQLQKALKYLGYPIDREDGYFDQETKECLESFEQQHDLEVDGIFTEEDNIAILHEVSLKWSEPDADVQKNVALEIINE